MPTLIVSKGRSSEFSTNNILSTFENKDIMTVENFHKKILPEDKIYIKDINLNSKKYFWR